MKRKDNPRLLYVGEMRMTWMPISASSARSQGSIMKKPHPRINPTGCDRGYADTSLVIIDLARCQPHN
ncbi:hypothetical protein [Adonisia turfae]|uniref:hypothetical protein n=1 Tax=Adonisia turfae TaxID=2950184 RepID=UPI0013D38247|nr:hypothetical protein [Adonisia turfae]